ncbi:adenylate kinase [Oenococcus alcoholitolerans]|uniref:adenylate kinase n=1 Tax=Oenococcus alcoholitolerans TaxID=931074 RepID=UPI003F717F41
MSLNLILLGLPGVGKGTNAERIEKDFHLPHISTGDIFRKAIADGTDLGKKVKEIIDNGNLVPDEVTDQIVDQRLEQEDVKKADGFILDGYPRNPAQAKALSKFLNSINKKIDAVIYLDASEETVTKRMINRNTGRADDDPNVIPHRIEVAKAQTMPLVDFYQQDGSLKTIKSDSDIETVYAEVKKTISSL